MRLSVGQAVVALVLTSVAGGCRGGGRGTVADGAPPLAAPAPVGAAAPVEVAARASPGEVVIAIDAEPAHLQPDVDPERWAFRIAYDNVYEPLVRASPGGGFEPVLASRMDEDADGRHLTFRLRHGVTFQDGAPLTADDVKTTFDRVRSVATHAPRVQAELADLGEVEVLGRETVRLWTRRPSAFLLGAVAEIGILPAHLFARGELHTHPGNRHPVGTGPFRVRSWERGRIVLERSDSYWGAAPAASRLVFVVERDGARALARARRGELDIVGHVPPLYVPEQIDSPSLRAGYEAVRLSPARVSFVLWNCRRPALADPAVRRALGAAVDRAGLLAAARHGLGRVVDAPPLPGGGEPGARGATLVPPTAAGAGAAVGVPSPQSPTDATATPATGEGIRRAGGATPGATTSGAATGGAETGGPTAGGARAGGARAGGATAGGATAGARPVRLTLLVPTGSREAEVAGKRIAEALGRVGVGVEIVAAEFATLGLRLKQGDFDAALLEWNGRDDDDLAPLLRSGGAQNFGGYSDHVVDELLDALRREGAAPVDGPAAPVGAGATRSALAARLADALAADPPALFLYAPEEVVLVARRLAPLPRLGDFFLLRAAGPR